MTRRPMRSDVLLEGVQAIDWTVDERGLAGLSDLEGIPWTMPMEQFFEAWVETVMRGVARQIGGTLKTGRRHREDLLQVLAYANLAEQRISFVVWYIPARRQLGSCLRNGIVCFTGLSSQTAVGGFGFG